MNEPKLAYIRIFGIPEIDEYNKERLLSTIDDGMEIELFEDKSARGLQEYLEFPPDRLYVNGYVIINMLFSTVEDIDEIKSRDEIFMRLANESDVLRVLCFSGIEIGDLWENKQIYREYLKELFEKVAEYIEKKPVD